MPVHTYALAYPSNDLQNTKELNSIVEEGAMMQPDCDSDCY